MQHNLRRIGMWWSILGMTASVFGREVEMPAPDRPRVEVVFVLDTTGSMSGLIEGAKQKIWAIANTLASAEPTPDIRVGLVGYRDRGDAYVTQRTALTGDLDKVYRDLMDYQAGGGGDGPESVNQALYEAVTQSAWTEGADTYRVIFLVGDFPPHMDYADDVKYPDSCRDAATAGITINTIQCGTHGPTEPIWREIAAKAEGRYFRVEQSGGAVVTATPFDDKLAQLSAELDDTRLYYGTDKDRREQEGRGAVADEIATAAPAAAKAQRAIFNAGAAGEANFLGRQELVSDVAEKKVDLAKLDADQLPSELRAMTPKQREDHVRQQAAKRNELQTQIKELGAKRSEHIKQQLAVNAKGAKDGFDAAIFECVKSQAGRKGIRLPEEQAQ